MEKQLKVKFTIGDIQFEAEGMPEDVERERTTFMNVLLPAAVDAMVRTRGAVADQQYLKEPDVQMLSDGDVTEVSLKQPITEKISRTSLSSFLKKYGVLSEQDFTLFSAYFYEKKTGNAVFSIDDVKRYYTEARRPQPSNPSMSLYKLAEKGYIMDAPDEETKGSKKYIISEDGFKYVENYIPKEGGDERKKAKPRKATTRADTVYSFLTSDDLNLCAYPAVKSFNGIKEQVILAMYIVTNEGKGEWFTVSDIEYILCNIFELPATKKAINGVFERNRSWFKAEQDTENKKAYRRKLLSGAKEFAKLLIPST